MDIRLRDTQDWLAAIADRLTVAACEFSSVFIRSSPILYGAKPVPGAFRVDLRKNSPGLVPASLPVTCCFTLSLIGISVLLSVFGQRCRSHLTQFYIVGRDFFA